MNNSQKNTQLSETFLNKVKTNIDSAFQREIIFPGEDVTTKITGLSKSIKIGVGLSKVDEKVISNTVGIISYRPPTSYWVESNRKRYFAKTGDQVVGIIEDRGGDFYTVNIFNGMNCILNRLSFEGATKRNKPELKRGDVIYARVLNASKDVDTELSCLTLSGSKKEWSTGETVIFLFFNIFI
jgi:exosome complex component RRP40